MEPINKRKLGLIDCYIHPKYCTMLVIHGKTRMLLNIKISNHGLLGAATRSQTYFSISMAAIGAAGGDLVFGTCPALLQTKTMRSIFL